MQKRKARTGTGTGARKRRSRAGGAFKALEIQATDAGRPPRPPSLGRCPSIVLPKFSHRKAKMKRSTTVRIRRSTEK